MQPDTSPTFYQIRIEGELDERWLRRFEGLAVTTYPDGETEISGVMIDQSALYGVLNRIRDLGLVLISVRRREDTRTST
jgi:hypothetical protein